MKGRDERGLRKQEETMKLITRFELVAKNKDELRGLLSVAFNKLARSEFGTNQHKNALTSIENIKNEITYRLSVS
tara:strand:+ start:4059 stop:4283 length:225 start_codon:yes stop_codon:yes gene_type:complete